MSAQQQTITISTQPANGGCLRRLVRRLSSDEWRETADLIDQCVELADIDASYSRVVRDKAISLLRGQREFALDRVFKANKEVSDAPGSAAPNRK